MKKIIAALVIVLALAVAALPAAGTPLDGKLMYGLGLFGGGYVYHTYLTIGLTSDAWAENSKSPEDTKSLLQTSVVSLKAAIAYLNELKDFSIAASDRDFIIAMGSACLDLQAEAEAMLRYIDKRRDADRLAFDRNRKSAWAKISKLIGLE